MASAKGMMVYRAYKALTYLLSPAVRLHMRWRSLRGLEHPLRWSERLGRASLLRPPGPLLWFHAASLGEGMAAVPVIKQCLEKRPEVHILLTTMTMSAFEVVKNQLPCGVLHQFAPLDTPGVVDAFLQYWKPNAIMIMESELWPNLIVRASENGIALALLNARMSTKSFELWSRPLLLPLMALMLSKFSLIIPLSNVQAIQFQLLQAPPLAINFSGDLKYAVAECDFSGENIVAGGLKAQLAQKNVWMASSLHRGEEGVMLQVHKYLTRKHRDIVTIIVPRHPQHGREIFHELKKEGQKVALRSQHEKLTEGTDIYIVDTLGELRHLYRLTPIAVIGGSFIHGLAGHNVSEAAAAGCAILTGIHQGHFSHMVLEMQRVNPLSVIQVSDHTELAEYLSKLFSDVQVLREHQLASRQAFRALSDGVVAKMCGALLSDVQISMLENAKSQDFHHDIQDTCNPGYSIVVR